MPMQRSLILIKPDALTRGLAGEIISRIEKKGLMIIAMKMIQLTPEICKEHYAHLASKPFYPGIEKFMISTPVIALVVEGIDAIEVMRKILGVTNSRNADPGTIRGEFSMSVSKNLVHASDSLETAEKEIKRFFKKEELFSWKRDKSLYYADDEQ